ncbi:hypothetical protein Tco_1107409 [Tanacetum coccineum]
MGILYKIMEVQKPVGFKQLSPGVETGVHGVHDEKRVWFESQSEYIDEFHKLVGDLAAIDTAISDEDQAFLLLTYLPSSYDNLKMTEAKGDGGEGLYVRRRSGQRDMEQYTDSAWSKLQERSNILRNEDQVFGSGADEYDNVDVMIAMSVEELLDWIMDSGVSYYITYMIDYLVDLEEYDGSNILLGDGRECRVRGDMSTKKCTKSGIAKHLGVAGLQQQNGLVEETNVTLLAKWVIKLWRLDDVTSKVVLYGNMGFNESREYKKTFIGSGVSMSSLQVLQGVEFEEVQTQDLIYYHLARDREQHSTHELFNYREDNNEVSFAVAEAEKIYAHKSLTFNNTVACEVISKWKAGLKDDMDARSDVYVLSDGCKKCSDDSDVYYWEYTPGIVIVKDQSGNTPRVSRSRSYNGKLVQTLSEGHSILSLKGSLSGDYDVEKNGKWSCIYAIGSQEYQVVCTRLDIASTDVGMLDKFDRGLQTDVHNFVDYDYTMGRSITVMVGYMTLTEAAKEAIWLKGLAIESGFELKIVAGIATGALSKAIPGPRFQHRLNLLSIGIG